MDINDYNTRLSQARENYHDKVREVKDGYTRQASDLESNHKTKQTAQQDAYLESQRKTEESTRVQQDNQMRKTREDVARIEKNFNNDIAKNREQFEDQSIKKQREFSNRLQDISESYYDSTKRAGEAHGQNIRNTKNQLEDRIKHNNEDSAVRLADVQNKSRGSFQKFQDDLSAEKRQLQKNHSNQFNTMVEQNNDRYATMVNKTQQTMQQTDNVHRQELRNKGEAHESSVGELRANQKISSEQMLRGFEDRLKDIDHKNEKIADRQRDEQNRMLRMNEQKNAKQVENEKKRVDAIVNGSSHASGAAQEMGIKERSFEERIGKLQDVMDEERHQGQVNKDKMMSENQEANRIVSNDNQKLIQKIQEDNADYFGKMNEKNRNEKEAVVSKYTDELKRTKDFSQDQLVANEKKSGIEYNTLRTEMGRQVNHLQEKNVATISEIQKENAKEKTQFIENAKRDVYNTREEIRDDNNQQRQRLIDSYTKKLDAAESEKKSIVSFYENQIANVKNKTNEELEHRTMVDQQRREQDVRSFKRAMDGKVREADMVITNIRREFDKKLAETKHHSEIHLQKMVERYEEEIKRMNMENKTGLDRKIGDAREQYERLVESSNIEKEQLKSGYELKIQNLRAENEKNREMRRAQMKNASNDDLA